MKFMRFWQQMPLALRRMLHKIAAFVPDGPPPHSMAWRIKRLLRLGLTDSRTIYLDTLCFFREEQKKDLYSDFLRQQVSGQFAPDYLNAILAKGASYPGIDPYSYAD